MTKEAIYKIAEDHIFSQHRETDKMDADRCETCRRIREEFIAAPSKVSDPVTVPAGENVGFTFNEAP